MDSYQYLLDGVDTVASSRTQSSRPVCVECHRRHSSCDGHAPCGTCLKKGTYSRCDYIYPLSDEKWKHGSGASQKDINLAHSKFSALLSQITCPISMNENNAPYHHITGLVVDAMRSKRGAEVLMSFRGEHAERIMDWLQTCIANPCPPLCISSAAPDYQHVLLRLLVKLSKVSGVLPHCLFLYGIVCPNRDSVTGGGFADIFRGTYGAQHVALKRLRVFKSDLDLEKSRSALCAEALVWQHLRHQHILPFLGVDINVFAPYHCMVSPWMENGNIMQCISSLSEKQVNLPFNRWIRQIAQGLAYLHDQHVVHGDLRGANILIDGSMDVQLCDFGLAMFADSTTASWGSAGGGAVRWLAPEVLKGSRPTFKSDTYAFGCVCLEVYTRKHPFAEINSDAQVVARVLQGARPEKPAQVGRYQTGFWNLVKTCWNEDPYDRPDASFLEKTLESQNDGILVADYDLVFTPNLGRPRSSSSPLSSRDSPKEDAYSSFSPASYRPTSVLKSNFGSPFTDADFSPADSSFGVVSLPTSSKHASPENSVPIGKRMGRRTFTTSPLVRPSPMSGSPFTMISSSAGSLPVAIAASKPSSFDSYERAMI
ncbi:kinase-like domain-containing protein [Cristinia sonorae]|uniref:Kinase-like domain-containing protein n=1 Tax=Cristinia sonorae TaxID=1940300 RepID=A0A8K0UEE3_9AGAR|nr:kinase-like domain-containing protein [Cristinia sonorae]